MNINQYRIRLLELRKKLDEMIEAELMLLNEDEVRQAKENNHCRVKITEGGEG